MMQGHKKTTKKQENPLKEGTPVKHKGNYSDLTTLSINASEMHSFVQMKSTQALWREVCEIINGIMLEYYDIWAS